MGTSSAVLYMSTLGETQIIWLPEAKDKIPPQFYIQKLTRMAMETYFNNCNGILPEGNGLLIGGGGAEQAIWHTKPCPLIGGYDPEGSFLLLLLPPALVA